MKRKLLTKSDNFTIRWRNARHSKPIFNEGPKIFPWTILETQESLKLSILQFEFQMVYYRLRLLTSKIFFQVRYSVCKTGTPQFNTDPLSSTHQFNIRTTLFQPPKSVSSTRQMRQFNTKKRQFNTPISSTHKKRPFNTKKRSFNTPISLTQKLFLSFFSWTDGCVELTLFVLNSRVSWSESFWCWTDGSLCSTDGCV